MMRFIGLAIISVLLNGCSTAVISDLEDDKVIVQATFPNDAQVKAEAARGCEIHGRKALSISKRCLDQYCTTQSFLFACQAKNDKKPPNNTEAESSDLEALRRQVKRQEVESERQRAALAEVREEAKAADRRARAAETQSPRAASRVSPSAPTSSGDTWRQPAPERLPAPEPRAY